MALEGWFCDQCRDRNTLQGLNAADRRMSACPRRQRRCLEQYLADSWLRVQSLPASRDLNLQMDSFRVGSLACVHNKQTSINHRSANNGSIANPKQRPLESCSGECQNVNPKRIELCKGRLRVGPSSVVLVHFAVGLGFAGFGFFAGGFLEFHIHTNCSTCTTNVTVLLFLCLLIVTSPTLSSSSSSSSTALQSLQRDLEGNCLLHPNPNQCARSVGTKHRGRPLSGETRTAAGALSLGSTCCFGRLWVTAHCCSWPRGLIRPSGWAQIGVQAETITGQTRPLHYSTQ